MTLIILIGPHAVGKMTVGQELERLSGFKLFHNHVTIEMVAPFFSYSTPQGRRLVNRLRQTFFDAFCESDAPGYIFTFVWAFGEPGEREYIEGITAQFEDKGHDTYWVELEASLEERLRRNRTENRLQHKPSKRDLDWSERNLTESAQKHRLNSVDGEIERSRYLRIDSTHRSAGQVAEQIWAHVTTG
ncbi:MAG: AAA family ATPase [Pseudomonadota bacterium]